MSHAIFAVTQEAHTLGAQGHNISERRGSICPPGSEVNGIFHPPPPLHVHPSSRLGLVMKFAGFCTQRPPAVDIYETFVDLWTN